MVITRSLLLLDYIERVTNAASFSVLGISLGVACMRITRITISSLSFLRYRVGFATHARGHVRRATPAGRPAERRNRGYFCRHQSLVAGLSRSTSVWEKQRKRGVRSRRRDSDFVRKHDTMPQSLLLFWNRRCTRSSPLPCCDYYKKRVCTYEKVERIVRYDRRESVRCTKCRVRLSTEVAIYI